MSAVEAYPSANRRRLIVGSRSRQTDTLRLPMAGRGMLRIPRQIGYPFAQHILMDIEIAGGLNYRPASSLNQPYRLKLERG